MLFVFVEKPENKDARFVALSWKTGGWSSRSRRKIIHSPSKIYCKSQVEGHFSWLLEFARRRSCHLSPQMIVADLWTWMSASLRVKRPSLCNNPAVISFHLKRPWRREEFWYTEVRPSQIVWSWRSIRRWKQSNINKHSQPESRKKSSPLPEHRRHDREKVSWGPHTFPSDVRYS